MVFLNKAKSLHATAFPLGGNGSGTGGSTTSARFRYLLGLLMLLPVQALASSATDRQIEQALDQYLQQRVEGYAQQQQWQGLRFVRRGGTVLGSKPAQPCSEPLTVGQADAASAPLGRQRLTLSCQDETPWRIDYLADIELLLPVLYTRQALERGQTLAEQHLQHKETALGGLQRGFYHHADEVLGKGAKRRLRAEQLLTPALLGEALLVKRGQQVRIEAAQQGISASTLGEALENGQHGDLIRVRNLGSDKVIKVRVVAEGVVSSRME